MSEFDHDAMQAHAADLRDDVLFMLSQHIGAARAIRAGDIARALGQHSDRAVREAIRQFRRDGHLVLSSVGANPGYYMAATPAEWRAFCDGNLRPRATDILETAHAMSDAAVRKFGLGDVAQLRLEL